ncbi:MAG: LON peptidase substrate-binding domain-containing protein [Alphaproteobacteria bacterium]
MTRGALDPGFENLPRVIPVFPLTGVLILPGGHLPLNIFEPRYLALTRAALAEEYHVIGMVQPRVPDPGDNRGVTTVEGGGDQPEIYATGCAGRITSFVETVDGLYQLNLTGLCRFDIVEEMASQDGYRRVLADYHRYRGDLADEAAPGIDRARLLTVIRRFFEHQGIEANWEAIEAAPDAQLVTSLAMSCPFNANERQALLEAPDTTERAQLIITLLEMALIETGGASGASH